MLTEKEVEEKGFIEGKDYIYLGGVRYQKGDKFLQKDREIGVQRIIDAHHFITDKYESWHTGMFDDSRCLHSKNMIPLAYNQKSFMKAQIRLTSKQVFNPDVMVLRGDGKIENFGECLIRYDKNTQEYHIQMRDKEIRDKSLHCLLLDGFGSMYLEMIYALQDWGESGDMPRELLLDDQCDKVRYEGIENTLVCEDRLAENPAERVVLLKKHCQPSQGFVIVKNLLDNGNEYVGETLAEETEFCDGVETFNRYAGRGHFLSETREHEGMEL